MWMLVRVWAGNVRGSCMGISTFYVDPTDIIISHHLLPVVGVVPVAVLNTHKKPDIKEDKVQDSER